MRGGGPGQAGGFWNPPEQGPNPRYAVFWMWDLGQVTSLGLNSSPLRWREGEHPLVESLFGDGSQNSARLKLVPKTEGLYHPCPRTMLRQEQETKDLDTQALSRRFIVLSPACRLLRVGSVPLSGLPGALVVT